MDATDCAHAYDLITHLVRVRRNSLHRTAPIIFTHPPSLPPSLKAGAVGSVTQLAQTDAGENMKDFLNSLATSENLKKTINDHSPCIGTTQEGGVDKFLSTYAARVKGWYGTK